ncbi:MAG: radical SAM family heme chaperone HemW [Candidatus Acidiferrales bacterium]
MSLGIYIQVPFCQTKCTYCNFHTGVFSNSLFAPYVTAVCAELSQHARLYETANVGGVAGEIVDTVYIGGGTPSLLHPDSLAQILQTACRSFSCELSEVTLEADPETITSEKANAWRSAGINRISMGAQSFNDRELQAAGRVHRRADIFSACVQLRAAGFQNISLDLIAGLPHQTRESWEHSLDELLRIRPEHVSIYLMEIDEGSRLGREVLAGGSRYSASALPSDDAMAEFYERACDRLAAASCQHYEISNWAFAGFRSKHNSKYWRREKYLGFGAGAHSFDGRVRWANVHDPAEYAQSIQQGRLPVEQREELSEEQALDEELFLGLRQLEGIDIERIESRYNVKLRGRLDALRYRGLVEIEGSRGRLAPARLAISNEAFVELLSAAE